MAQSQLLKAILMPFYGLYNLVSSKIKKTENSNEKN